MKNRILESISALRLRLGKLYSSSEGLRFLGGLLGNGNGAKGEEAFLNLSMSPHLEEEYERIRANLLAAGNGDGPRAFVVTGSIAGEGATTTAALLGMTLAAEGPTVLVDGNLRTPTLGRLLHTRNLYGLSDILTSETPLGACLRESDVPGLWVLPAGATHPKPVQLFTSPAFSNLVEQLKRRFSFVIFDCPPLSVYSEGVYVATKVDGVVMVVHAEKTPVEVAYRTKVQLERAGARILGALLTQKKEYVPEIVSRWISL